jgi:hypothetical protein
MDCYTFSGTVGARIRLRMVNTSGGSFFPLQEVTSPDGTTLCGPQGPNDMTCTLDDGGTHTVIVRDSAGTNTGGYTMAIQKLSAPLGCTALTFGAAPISASIGAVGEMDCYSFTGTMGDRIRIRVVETSGSLLALQEVVRPNGTTVCGQTSAADETCLLDTTGAHRIIVEDNNGNNTGGYVIAIQKLNAPVGCTALTFGAAPLARTISTAGEMDCYTFSGTVGARIRLRMVNTSGGSFFPTAEVVRPNGKNVCGPQGPNDITCTLNRTGTHTIIVEDSAGTNTGNYKLEIQKLNAPVGCTAIVYGGGPTAGSISTSGEFDCFTFTGAHGDQVNVHTLKTSGTLATIHELIRPNGTTICGPQGGTDMSCTLDSDGTYTIIIEDSAGTNTGGYTTQVQKLN